VRRVGAPGPGMHDPAAEKRTGRDAPAPTQILLLVIGFLRGLLDLHLELVDDVERALGGGPAR
jgi:hypothetical protein